MAEKFSKFIQLVSAKQGGQRVNLIQIRSVISHALTCLYKIQLKYRLRANGVASHEAG